MTSPHPSFGRHPVRALLCVQLLGLLSAAGAGSALAAQGSPRLEPLSIADPLAVLDFWVDQPPPMLFHSSGCVVLFDPDASQVVCIDPNSGVVRRFGRKGSGPGEFRMVRSMASTPDGGLLVADFGGNRRLTLISKDWKLGRMVPASQQFVGLFRATRDSVLTIGGKKGRELVSVSLGDGGNTIHFAPAASDTMLFVGPYEFDLFGFFTLPRRRGGWFIASAWHYAILVEDDRGRVLSRIARDVPREPFSARELDDVKAVMVRANPGMKADAFMERYAKNLKPAIQAAPVEDANDRLWVPSGRVRQDSTEVDVFDAGGKFVGTRRVPGRVWAMVVRGDELFAMVEYLVGPRAGNQGVARYRIR